MRKNVLGNDPFQRGAAQLPALPAISPPRARIKIPRGIKPPARRRAPTAEPSPPAATQAASVREEPRPTRTAALQSGAGPGPIFKFLFDLYWRVHSDGADQLPSAPSILIANHAGALPLDGPILAMALRRARPDLPEPVWLAEDQILNTPLLGGSLFGLGAVPASFQNGLRLLQEGRSILVFPEGTQGLSKPFFERYQLKRFGRGGFLKLAQEANAAVVPVGVIGGEEAMPALAKLPGVLGVPYLPLTIPPLPTKWSIRFGSPLALDLKDDELEGEHLQGLIEVARQSVDSLVKSLLAQRQSLFW